MPPPAMTPSRAAAAMQIANARSTALVTRAPRTRSARFAGSLAFTQIDVRGGAGARLVIDTFVAQRAQIHPREDALPASQQRRRDDEVELVDQAGAQVLADRGDPAAQADVAPRRGFLRLLERSVDSFGDEMKHGAAFHRQRRPRMMRQHEDRRVVRRLLAPPTLPTLVGPRSADGSEHVAP